MILTSGTVAGQLIVVASSPLLTRIYSPGDFGVLASYVAVVGILSVTASLRYELAIPLPGADGQSINLLALCTLLLVVTTFMLTAILTVWGTAILGSVGLDELDPYRWLISIGFFALGLYQVLSFWAIRAGDVVVLARTKVFQGAGSVSAQIGLGLAHGGPLGLLVGSVIGQAAGSSSLARSLWRDGPILRTVSRVGMGRVASRYRRFPLYSSWSALLNSAGLYLAPLLLLALYGPRVAGLFALSDRVGRVPLNLLGLSVAQVYLAEASSLARRSRAQLYALYNRIADRLLLVGSCVIVPLAVTAPWLFSLVFGESWRTAGFYVTLLAPALLAQFVVSPLAQTLNVLERQTILAVLDGVRVILVVLAFAIPFRLGWEASLSIAAYSGVTSALYAVYWWFARQSIRGARPQEMNQ